MKILIFFIYLLQLFTLNLNSLETNNQKNSSRKIEWTEEALPTNFFGDYSYPEFWVNKNSGEVEYEKPNNIDEYEYHFSHVGSGISSFTYYTSLFNQAILEENYNPTYKNKYINAVENNPNGFQALNSNWKIANFSSYVEDWIIWNWNEELNMDFMDSSQLATNDNLNFVIKIYGNFYTTNELQTSSSNIGNSSLDDYHIEELGISNNYTIVFEEEPTFDMTLNNETSSFQFSTYSLEQKLLPPTKQYVISEKDFNEDYYHSQLKKDLDQNDSFENYKDWFERKIIINELNKDFIEEYGEGELGHDYNQGYHQIEDIRLDDLDITYYELENNTWKEIEKNKYDENLSNFLEIKTVVKTKNTNIFFKEDQEISIIFNPSKELINHTKRGVIAFSIVILIFILTAIITISIALIFKPKTSNKNQK